MITLFGKNLRVGDKVYSGSQGYGTVISITSTIVQVSHSGNNWNYNSDLIRSGCKVSDLYWMPPLTGVQVRSTKKQDVVQAASQAINNILTNLVD